MQDDILRGETRPDPGAEVPAERLKVGPEGEQRAVVAFTDLDGTAFDETRGEAFVMESSTYAAAAFDVMQQDWNIPVGIITGRALGEALFFEKHLNLEGPVICEDGAVVVLDKDALPDENEGNLQYHSVTQISETRVAVRISKISADDISDLLDEVLEKSGGPAMISSFSDPGELQEAVGHTSVESAERSAHRIASAYVEEPTDQQFELMCQLGEERGIRVFNRPRPHLIGEDADKQEALKWVVDLYKEMNDSNGQQLSGIIPMVFGNSENDVGVLGEAAAQGGFGVIVGHPAPDRDFFVADKDIPDGTIRMERPFGQGIAQSLPVLKTAFLNHFNVALGKAASEDPGASFGDLDM